MHLSMGAVTCEVEPVGAHCHLAKHAIVLLHSLCIHYVHFCNNRGLIDRYAGPAFSKLFDDNSHLFLSFDPNIRSFVIPDAVRCASIL